MYSGLYYVGAVGRRRPFDLCENDENYDYRPEYKDYGVILRLLAGGHATLLRTKVLPDDYEDRLGEDLDPSVPHQRYDLYGFKTMSLDEAKQLVEDALGIRFEWDKSSLWGSGGFYCVRSGKVWDYILYRNTGDEPEHPRFRDHGVILSVDHVADMDEIKRKLTEGRTEPKHLRTKREQIFDEPSQPT